MAATTGQPTTTNRQSWLQAVVSFREAGIIIIILLLSVLVTLRSPAFLTLDNLRDILLTISILVIVALGQTMVIITRGIDLSVGSMIGLTAMIVSFFVVNFPDTHPAVAVVMGMAIGTILGGINGVVISYAGVPPIIATLGTLSVYRGLVFWYSEGSWVNAFEMPQPFRDLAKGTPLGVPNLIIFAVVVAIAIYLFLNYTRMGRNIYAVGSNPDAAKFAGIPTQRVIFTVYLLSGLLCGLAGVLWASRFEAAQTNTALGFELQTVAAPVVGGVNIFGGSGSVVSVLLGAFLLGIINNALTLVRISPFWQLAAQGLLILASVVADAAIIRRLQALAGRSRT